jgi:hypothetical protein
MSLTQFPATIEAQLTDGKGKVACRAVGKPADTNKDGVWVLMSAPGEAGYWHYGCNFVPVSTFRSYDLMIRVTEVGAKRQQSRRDTNSYGRWHGTTVGEPRNWASNS